MNSNAAAIRRRAQPQPQTKPQQPVQTVQRQVQIATPQPPVPPSLPTRVEPGQQLTLPQAVQILEFRVTNLEKSMKESAASQPEPIQENVNEDILQVIDEYDERFNILASELKEVKDLLLSLQKYTMEVNKVLYEERVRLLSDIDREASASEQA